jgi:hypothetical protein
MAAKALRQVDQELANGERGHGVPSARTWQTCRVNYTPVVAGGGQPPVTGEASSVHPAFFTLGPTFLRLCRVRGAHGGVLSYRLA